MFVPSSVFPDSLPVSSVGALIRHRRQALGMTQEELALRLSPDLGPQDIDALESGRIVVPCWSLVQRLGQALGLTNDAILVGFLASTGTTVSEPGAPMA